MPVTVAVEPEIIRWAIDRSGLSPDDLASFPVEDWQAGRKQPTLRKLEDFAKKTMVPLGYLFLAKPPVETIPLPDFRTVGDTPLRRPSPNLIDTLHTMQRRQAWMRDYLLEMGHDALPFVGSVKVGQLVAEVVALIRSALGLAVGWAERESNWQEALRRLRRAIEGAGILVAVNGIVGNNTKRKLDPQEFRGFVMADRIAPLIFVNGSDSQSAQIFTLAHELVHVWCGQDGLFNLLAMRPANDRVEKYCNRVAAEFLVPKEKLSGLWPKYEEAEGRFEALAREFKVSPLVVAQRALDLDFIEQGAFFVFYNQYLEKLSRLESQKRRGGDFYRNVSARIGDRFGYAVIQSAKEGRLLYRDAYALIGLSGKTFDEYARILSEKMRK